MNNKTLHIISASNVQELARLIQEEYYSSTGHKLKRSILLNDLSKALLLANKKVMESSSELAINKDLPCYVGSSNYELKSSETKNKPKIFISFISEEDLLNQINEELFNRLWDSLCFEVLPELIEFINYDSALSKIFKDNESLLLPESKEKEKDPYDWDISYVQKVSEAMMRIPELKNSAIEIMQNESYYVDGEHTIKCISEGIEEKKSLYLLEVVNQEDKTSLKGLFEVDLFDLSEDVNIEGYFNSSVFNPDDNEIILSDAKIKIVHDHGRSTNGKDATIFIYVEALIDDNNEGEFNKEEIIDLFARGTV